MRTCPPSPSLQGLTPSAQSAVCPPALERLRPWPALYPSAQAQPCSVTAVPTLAPSGQRPAVPVPSPPGHQLRGAHRDPRPLHLVRCCPQASGALSLLTLTEARPLGPKDAEAARAPRGTCPRPGVHRALSLSTLSLSEAARGLLAGRELSSPWPLGSLYTTCQKCCQPASCSLLLPQCLMRTKTCFLLFPSSPTPTPPPTQTQPTHPVLAARLPAAPGAILGQNPIFPQSLPGSSSPAPTTSSEASHSPSVRTQVLPYLTSGTVTELSAMLVDRMIYQTARKDRVLTDQEISRVNTLKQH